MIDPKTLTEEDIGRHVIYKPFYLRDKPSEWEHGVISSFRKEAGVIFARFKGPTGERCCPDDLFWE